MNIKDNISESPIKRLQIMLNNSTSIAFGEFVRNLFSDYTKYPNGSNIFVSITDQ